MFNDFLLKSQGILLKTGCIYWGAVIDNEHCGLESPYGHQNMYNLLVSAKEVYVNVR